MISNEQRAHDLAILILQNQDSAESLLMSLNKLDECLVSIDENTERFDIVKAYKFIVEDILNRLI